MSRIKQQFVVRMRPGWWYVETRPSGATVWASNPDRDEAKRMTFAKANIVAYAHNATRCEPDAYVELWQSNAEAHGRAVARTVQPLVRPSGVSE